MADDEDYDESYRNSDSTRDMEAFGINFMFGNIDAQGQLETDDFFDEECREHLSQLVTVDNSLTRNFGSLIDKNAVKAQRDDDDDYDEEETEPGSERTEDVSYQSIESRAAERRKEAEDFGDISELAPDESDAYAHAANAEQTSRSFDRFAVPFPVRAKEEPDVETQDKSRRNDTKAASSSKLVASTNEVKYVTSESVEQDAYGVDSTAMDSEAGGFCPLANIRPKEMANMRIQDVFPDFSYTKQLKWGRIIFQPVYLPKIWKRGKRGQKKSSDPQSEVSLKGCFSRLNFGTPASYQQRAIDEERIFLASRCSVFVNSRGQLVSSNTLRRRNENDSTQRGDSDMALEELQANAQHEADRIATNSWRLGPARLWYDRMHVRMSDRADQIYRKRFEQRKEMRKQSEPSKREDAQSTQSEGRWFTSLQSNGLRSRSNLVDERALRSGACSSWEDHVILDSSRIDADEVRRQSVARAAYCAWIPSSTARTVSQFRKLTSPSTNVSSNTGQSSTLVSLLHPAGANALSEADSKAAQSGRFRSLFAAGNDELTNGDWERHIIFDVDVEPPSPPRAMTIDLNDEYFTSTMPLGAAAASSLLQYDNLQAQVGAMSGLGSPTALQRARGRPTGLASPPAGNSRGQDEAPLPSAPGQAATTSAPASASMSTETEALLDWRTLSNDEHYPATRSTNELLAHVASANVLVQHSVPALELYRPWFPVHIPPLRAITFHRAPLRRFATGVFSAAQFDVAQQRNQAAVQNQSAQPPSRTKGGRPVPQVDAQPESLTTGRRVPVINLTMHVRKVARQRERERGALGNTVDLYYARTPQDLTPTDGELVLLEYSEEHPALMNQIGMAVKLRNYVRRPDRGAPNWRVPDFRFGETTFVLNSPFLGQLSSGQWLSALECNLFRAPIYQHYVPQTDFLLIRNRHGFFVRHVPTIFCVGQQLPLVKVHHPNSSGAREFESQLIQYQIYRMFAESSPDETPKRLSVDELRRAFPHVADSSMRKRLRDIAECRRAPDVGGGAYWELRPDVRLPTREELREVISPEQCCAYYSMVCGEARLREIGYSERDYAAADSGDESSSRRKFEPEVLTAPWNTTSAFLAATKGKCLLQLNGPADPTGFGEGYSYTRLSLSSALGLGPEAHTLSAAQQQKLSKMNADGDLRKISAKEARVRLGELGIFAPEEVKRMSRWRIIETLKNLTGLSGKNAYLRATGAGNGPPGSAASQFTLGASRQLSFVEQLERYRAECQRLFEMQNEVLGSTETFESASESENASDAERDELTGLTGSRSDKNLDQLVGSGKSAAAAAAAAAAAQKRRVLKLSRTFVSDSGKPYVREEYVRNIKVIEAYVKARQKGDEFIRKFVANTGQSREDAAREKRRAQLEARRKGAANDQPASVLAAAAADRADTQSITADEPMPDKRDRQSLKDSAGNPRVKCSACGAIGHMRSNKLCPRYGDPTAKVKRGAAAPSADDTADVVKNRPDNETENLIRVEGTKIKMSKELVERYENERRKSMRVTLPKALLDSPRRRGRPPREGGSKGNAAESDEATPGVSAKPRGDSDGVGEVDQDGPRGREFFVKPRHSRVAHRRRVDPKVVLNGIFESIANEMRHVTGSEPFHQAVKERDVPDYYAVIKSPMDLTTIKTRAAAYAYASRDKFLADVVCIVQNSQLYNGKDHPLSRIAQQLFDLCLKRLTEKEEKLKRLEKLVNPLLDDNDLNALAYIFEQAVERMKEIENCGPFLKPVNKKTVPTYHAVIKTPMDMSTLLRNVQAKRYRSRRHFETDAELIFTNCATFNGEESNLTATARAIVDSAKRFLDSQAETIAKLEAGVREQLGAEAVDGELQQAARDADEQRADAVEMFGEISSTEDEDDDGDDEDDDGRAMSDDSGSEREPAASASRKRAREPDSEADDDDEEDDEGGEQNTKRKRTDEGETAISQDLALSEEDEDESDSD